MAGFELPTHLLVIFELRLADTVLQPQNFKHNSPSCGPAKILLKKWENAFHYP